MDKVKPLKLENPSNGGTQTDIYPTEVNPSQDLVQGKGVALGANGTVVLQESLGVMLFSDEIITTPISLSSIVQGIALPRYTMTLVNNGTYTNNQWIGYSELLPGQNCPIVFPRTCKVVEMTFANQNTNCQFTFTFRRGSTTGTILATWAVATGTGKTAVAVNQNLTFLSGDTLYVQYTKTGGSTPSDAVIVLFIQNTG